MGYDMRMVRTPESLPPDYEPPYEGSPGYYRYNVWGMSVTRGFMGEWAEACYEQEIPDFPAPEDFGLSEEDWEAYEEWRGWQDDLPSDDEEDEEDLDEEDEDPNEGASRPDFEGITLKLVPPPTPDARVIEAGDRYRAAVQEICDRETLEDGQVASYKWSSNDGWLVTPAECRAIAVALRRSIDMIAEDYFPDIEGLTEQDGQKWVRNWMRFHEIAAEHGGYRVY